MANQCAGAYYQSYNFICCTWMPHIRCLPNLFKLLYSTSSSIAPVCKLFNVILHIFKHTEFPGLIEHPSYIRSTF